MLFSSVRKGIFGLALGAAAVLCAGGREDDLGLVPRPSQLELGGLGFEIRPTTLLVLEPDNAETRALGKRLDEALAFAKPLPRASEPGAIGFVHLVLNPAETDLGEEGYRLQVGLRGLEISAAAPAGIFYGIQTLRQLLEPLILSGHAPSRVRRIIPGLKIEDRPRFKLRGFMLDVGRHFYAKNEVLRYLDLLALHKFNRFHWHLTEDQGWRIQIKKYPKLTEVGAWREEAGKPYGGFYTQKELREVVAYAKERHITVVPEIEMPGHSSAALASYPELGCTGGPYKVPITWGVFNDVLCPGKESTFSFIEDVLTEVMDIFPSEEIHIGGDECPKERWHAHDLCQLRMKQLGLKDEKALQSYFVGRIAAFLKSKGRRMVGWDEICEGGLAEGATVQWWNNPGQLVDAAKAGHSIIASNFVDTYLDQMHLAVSNRRLYEFSLYPPGLPEALRGQVLGAESPLWTEDVPDRARLDYQAFPRLCALAENLWLSEDQKDYASFERRLNYHHARLDALGVAYRDLGVVAGSWGPETLGKDWKSLSWNLSPTARIPGTYDLALEYDKGPSNLLIRSMELSVGDSELKRVTTSAVAGYWIYQPELSFELKPEQLKQPLLLKISAKGEKGPESYGNVFVKLRTAAPPRKPAAELQELP